MPGFKCPFCGMVMSISSQTQHVRYSSFDDNYNKFFPDNITPPDDAIKLEFYQCPNCGKHTIICNGMGEEVEGLFVPIHPRSSASIFPEYIPQAIRDDYEEAHAIISLSPKASATLSRRCLQGMIHDFWNIHEKNLNAEITALKSRVPTAQWKAIDSLRRIGNIGAHMERDVNQIIDVSQSEAERLLQLIEQLIKDWYIGRHEQELLYEDIISFDCEKTEQRQKSQDL